MIAIPHNSEVSVHCKKVYNMVIDLTNLVVEYHLSHIYCSGRPRQISCDIPHCWYLISSIISIVGARWGYNNSSPLSIQGEMGQNIGDAAEPGHS